MCAVDNEIGQTAAHTPTGGVCTVCGYDPGQTNDYTIGDTGPAGGIIFYVSSSGFTMTGTTGTFHYLEVSAVDVLGGPSGSDVTMAWTISASPIITGTSGTIGSGKNNTTLIIAGESASLPGNGYRYAARVCVEPSASSAQNGWFGGKDDWFLPSIDELDLLFDSQVDLDITLPKAYWSSTQNDVEDKTSDVLVVDFKDGEHYSIGKTNFQNVSVRAIRAF
ncbi:MAG: DUF1566 domain-containing protein [Treponema sp.]|nr:DUF1566 domain-containing protein [Treponema sp.]